MEIDKKTIKALAAGSRLEILRSLGQRRKMPSELQKELSMAGSTIVQHLKVLEKADLVRKENRGNKFVYYSLTNKGEGLIKPRGPVQFVLMFTLGLMFFAGAYVRNYFTPASNMVRAMAESAAQEAAGDAMLAPGAVASASTFDPIIIILLILGVVFFVLGIIGWNKWKSR